MRIKYNNIDVVWQKSHLDKIRNRAGTRYSPALNVDLPITEIFDGLTRNLNFYTSIRKHFGNLNRELGIISFSFNIKELQSLNELLRIECSSIFNMLKGVKNYSTQIIPWNKINNKCNKAITISWELSDKIRNLKSKLEKGLETNAGSNYSSSEKYTSDLHHLHEVIKELKYLENFSDSPISKLSNNPILLINGIAGAGKTHLLCDVIENRAKGKLFTPSILTFGELFKTIEDPFLQIIQQLDINLSKSEFLTQLNTSSKHSHCRAIIAIDALNETETRNYWKRNLARLIKEIKKYPNLALIISIRKGFEDDIITKGLGKSIIQVEHRGFEFREWEAVSKIFKEFDLPIPEIPLLLPEFQNPLFLILFCKAVKARTKSNKNLKQKQAFRGHEGATYIFESFVDSVSKSIEKQFDISSLRGKNIWDTVIEVIASEMVKINKDRIDETSVVNIITTAHPSIDYHMFIKELERNYLIVRVPKYSRESKGYDGFEIRFPFQKFSDHLIGRYFFKQFEKEFTKSNKSLATGKRFFSKRRKLGKYLADSWNRGIVEALSTQCPEHFNGLELIEIAPYLKNNQIAKEAFIESLIWRKPTAFTPDCKNTFAYINSKILPNGMLHSELINAFLSVASVQGHPFNADFLHKHLSSFTLAHRDAWWSSNFLHFQIDQRGAVDRLIEWGWSNQDKQHINDEAIRLTSIALCWFLATPNRFLRDKATKALVSVLTSRLLVTRRLLEQFKDVNDLYILERMFGVAYGCAVNSRNDKEGLKLLSQWVYDNLFLHGKPPTHILIRDYARGIIEVALKEGIGSKISVKKVRPPFKTVWPKSIPSLKKLKDKYYPENFYKSKTKERGFLDIWSSVMYDDNKFGDFGHYVVNSNLEHWSGRKLNGNEINRKKLYNDFKKSLNKKQIELLKLATFPINDGNFFTSKPAFRFKPNIKQPEVIKIQLKNRNLKKIQKQVLNELEESLTEDKRLLFITHLKPFLSSRGIDDPLERFNTGLAQRWLFDRVIQLGWNPQMHGEFDSNVNNDRTDRAAHKAERIGKKYQWIAFHEILALVSDNFEFKGENWSNKVEKFNGPWQISVRDIDPTCLLKDSSNSKFDSVPHFDNYEIPDTSCWNRKISNSRWIRSSADLPGPLNLIELVDDQNNIWLSLENSVEWTEETPPEYNVYDLPRRKLWYMIKSYLVKTSEKQKMYDWSKRQHFMERWMPESHEFYNIFLGEFPWGPSYLDHYKPQLKSSGWTNDSGRKKIPVKVLITDEHYLSGDSSFDCSSEETINIKLPAKFIIDEMGLTQPNSDGRFLDKAGKLVAFDPKIINEKLQNHILIRKDSLTKFLMDKGLSIIWTVLGEKQIIGSGRVGKSQGWLEVDGAYTLSKRSKIIGKISSQFINPRHNKRN